MIMDSYPVTQDVYAVTPGSCEYLNDKGKEKSHEEEHRMKADFTSEVIFKVLKEK